MGYYGQGWRCGAERGDIRVKDGGVELRGGGILQTFFFVSNLY